MREKNSRKVLLCLAFCHLVFVSLSASYIKVADYIPGKNIIDFYLKATGADSSYGFFAPAIGVKTRALFDIVDHNGNKTVGVPLIAESEREVEIRLGGIFDEFTSEDADDERFRKPLAASLAAAMFSQHKNAAEVTLHVQEFWPKTMEEYRQGEKAKWSDYYAARFVRTENDKGDVQ